jgi:threonine/homoserine/homoserine lactone efflux protein
MPPHQHHSEEEVARQGRLVALVIAGTMLLWMAAQWLGAALELPARFVFLFDLAALAGFIWALFVGVQIWRKRRDG